VNSLDASPKDVRQRNRRLATLLLGWIALLVVLSIIVIWVKH
jgi:hypothetical protein